MKTMTKQMSKLEANVQFEKDVKAAELEIKATLEKFSLILVPQLAFAQNNQALVPTLSYARRQGNASEVGQVASKENAKVKKGKK